MNKLFTTLLVAVSVSVAGLAQAAERGTKEEAIALVEKVIDSIKKVGKEKTIELVNDTKGGPFREKDLYITIMNLKGVALAHGANPKMQGKDLSELKDADGKEITKDRLKAVAASKDGTAWVDYLFPNPSTKEIEKKSSYSKRYEDLIINCGIYK